MRLSSEERVALIRLQARAAMSTAAAETELDAVADAVQVLEARAQKALATYNKDLEEAHDMARTILGRVTQEREQDKAQVPTGEEHAVLENLRMLRGRTAAPLHVNMQGLSLYGTMDLPEVLAQVLS